MASDTLSSYPRARPAHENACRRSALVVSGSFSTGGSSHMRSPRTRRTRRFLSNRRMSWRNFRSLRPGRSPSSRSPGDAAAQVTARDVEALTALGMPVTEAGTVVIPPWRGAGEGLHVYVPLTPRVFHLGGEAGVCHFQAGVKLTKLFCASRKSNPQQTATSQLDYPAPQVRLSCAPHARPGTGVEFHHIFSPQSHHIERRRGTRHSAVAIAVLVVPP